ncbi:MAG: ATPase, partial [Oscillospiraceae bacterium]
MPRGRPRKNPDELELNIEKKSVGRPPKKPDFDEVLANPAEKVKKPLPKAEKPAKPAEKAEQGDLIFSLDIGTRTVVGIVLKKTDEHFEVLGAISLPHVKRSMVDGQIEDIDEVAKMVNKVKTHLEEQLNLNLTKVCIAAAGRALKTKHIRVDIDIETQDYITEEMVKSYEMETVAQAQAELDKEKDNENLTFYCVGHTIVNYFLDNYPIKSFVGHKGKVASVDMLAAFLPNMVVESLYAVMDKNSLEVSNLTLEPIAAMNVIVPPSSRLINIALVDIGAGTSDIAISRGGSVVAYAMATIAGDEITEEIIKQF